MATINEQFIQVKTKANFESRLQAGDIQDSSIAFIEDEDQIWAKGKYYSTTPAGGHERLLLAWESDGKAKWEDLANMFTGLEELLAYGVEWDITVGDPHITRIGNMSLHKTLPIQSQLKGCIAQGDKVIYWLDESDWRWKKDSETQTMTLAIADTVYTLTADIFATKQYEKQWVKISNVACQISSIDTSSNAATLVTNDDLVALALEAGDIEVELGAVLNGYDGVVRVYCPNFYIKSQVDGNKRRVWLSTVKIDNTWTYQHEILVDAYRSTVLNTVPENMGYLSTLTVNSAISVVNTETYCRGGGNRTANDLYLDTDPFKTDLGKPRTNIPRATMRTYSRNAGSEMLSYDLYKNIFYWLYVVEYANFNCLEAFNEELTTEGFKLGGMGPGITDVNSSKWSAYNGYYPLTPCGYGNELGNGIGIKQLVLPAEGSYAESTHYMPRWRGFDNPFGDIWTNLDGIVIERTTGLSNVWTSTDPDEYTDVIGGKDLAGQECLGEGYIKTFDLGETAQIIPSANGGSTTTYKCDYHWRDTATSGLRTLLVGGSAHCGGGAGLGGFHSSNGVSRSAAYVGFRSVSSFMSFSLN